MNEKQSEKPYTVDIQILDRNIDTQKCIDFVKTPKSGGIVNFIGTARNQTKGRKVLYLTFEAYRKMALSEMKKITHNVRKRWKIHKIAIYHRTGIVQISEIAVAIAVSAPHRNEAFLACQYSIDALKKTVPIWKKETFEDGQVWVAAHP